MERNVVYDVVSDCEAPQYRQGRGMPKVGSNLQVKTAAFIATMGYAGYSPIAPGTVGTILGIPFYVYIARLHYLAGGAVILCLSVMALWASIITVNSDKKDDPPYIICDETVGFLVASYMISPSVWSITLLFLIFRIFDILKPFPIGFIDHNVRGGTGVLLDDIVAGICSNLSYHLLVYIVTP